MKNSTYAEMDAALSRAWTRIIEKDAEIERLRAALREIASDDLYMRNGASWHDVAKMQDGVRQITREALGR